MKTYDIFNKVSWGPYIEKLFNSIKYGCHLKKFDPQKEILVVSGRADKPLVYGSGHRQLDQSFRCYGSKLIFCFSDFIYLCVCVCLQKKRKE